MGSALKYTYIIRESRLTTGTRTRKFTRLGSYETSCLKSDFPSIHWPIYTRVYLLNVGNILRESGGGISIELFETAPRTRYDTWKIKRVRTYVPEACSGLPALTRNVQVWMKMERKNTEKSRTQTQTFCKVQTLDVRVSSGNSPQASGT